MTYPPDFTHPVPKAEIAAYAASTIAALAADHRVVVQAGGCAGLWPLALAERFARVYTFEPAPENFRYLAANVADVPTVTAFPFALGETAQSVGLSRPKPKAGLWRVDGDGDGAVPMRPLDAVLDEPIDALVLDVEGSEVPALRGAARLIDAHRPLLWLECLQQPEAITAFLSAHGYTRPVHGLGGDYYSVHTSRPH